MIDLKTAELIHFKSVEEFGGSQGTRDYGALDAALNRPFATFDCADLYSTPIDKAAALLESIVSNHPFIDGNMGEIGFEEIKLWLTAHSKNI
jgi:death-on-curing protein